MDHAGKFNRWWSYKMSKEQQLVVLHCQVYERPPSAYAIRAINGFENVKNISEGKNEKTI